MLSQFAGVRPVRPGDGVERGIRMLEFRTGSGLRFTALVDRALDIADCGCRGRRSAGIRPPGSAIPASTTMRVRGVSPERSFSGLLANCGLDHIFGPEEMPADTYNDMGKRSVLRSLYRRVRRDEGAQAVGEAERRIRSIARPEDEAPTLSGISSSCYGMTLNDVKRHYLRCHIDASGWAC